VIRAPETRQQPTCRNRTRRNEADFGVLDAASAGTALAAPDAATRMLDREKIVAVLTRRFPGSATEQVAAAANAIVGLEDEWVEVQTEGGWKELCRDRCCLTAGGEIKVFRRKKGH
jgi:hypothetical protein